MHKLYILKKPKTRVTSLRILKQTYKDINRLSKAMHRKQYDIIDIAIQDLSYKVELEKKNKIQEN